MHRVTSCAMLLMFIMGMGTAAFAQDNTSAAMATCNFDEQKQLVVHYQRTAVSLKKPLSAQVPFDKVWAPGGKPLTLFTNTPIQVGARQLGIGAYTLFLIPNSKQWTLVVSKSTDTTGAYDEKQDLVRVGMDSGELPSPQSHLSVGFVHITANQCTLRVDLEKKGHFAVFQGQ